MNFHNVSEKICENLYRDWDDRALHNFIKAGQQAGWDLDPECMQLLNKLRDEMDQVRVLEVNISRGDQPNPKTYRAKTRFDSNPTVVTINPIFHDYGTPGQYFMHIYYQYGFHHRLKIIGYLTTKDDMIIVLKFLPGHFEKMVKNLKRYDIVLKRNGLYPLEFRHHLNARTNPRTHNDVLYNFI